MTEPRLWVRVSDKYRIGNDSVAIEATATEATATAAATAVTITENKPFEVEIRSSGEILQVPADRTLVEVLQQSGLPIPRNCPRSFCGGCAVTVLEGDVEHRDTSLPDQLRNEMGKMLSCVSRAKSARLVLDL
ncbi:MAG: 2Fe-2S iron-sulfur cluster binding domain-containing protein [Motiliproteus sp.]